MTPKTATIAVLVVVAAAPIVKMNLVARRRKTQAAENLATVTSINEMMNKMDGTENVVHVITNVQ